MKLSEIVDKLALTVLTGETDLDRDVTGVYSGDLISDVMSNSREGQLWVTLQAHPNVVAVASLRELSGVVIVNQRTPTEETIAKAEQEGLSIMGTDLPAYEICGRLYNLLAG